MAEIQAISAGLTAIKSAIEIAKNLREADRSLREAEYRLRIVSLLDQLVTAKESLLAAKEENLLLRESIANASKERELKASLMWDGTKYWLRKDGNEKEGPFCQKCQDENQKLIRLHFAKDAATEYAYWSCLTCGFQMMEGIENG